MGTTFSRLVADGPLLVAAAVAMLVGLISFASPCVLPLVPGYLAYVSGLVGTGLRRRHRLRRGRGRRSGGAAVDTRSPRTRMVAARCCSCSVSPSCSSPSARRSAVWAGCWPSTRRSSTGCSASSRSWSAWRSSAGCRFLQRTARLSVRPVAGLAGAPLLGIVFGLGWTPCLGPTLAAVYSLAFSQATATRGAILGVAYCIGLGVPFVLVALGARWAMGATGFLRRHAQTVTRVGGAVLVLVGLLLVTGAWTELMGWLRSWLATTDSGSRRCEPQRTTAADAAARHRRPSPSAARRVAGAPAALVAPAHRDADGDHPAVPAGAGRRPGLVAAAALAVAEQGVAVLHRSPDAGAGAGPALPVRRLQLALVRRGLPAAVHLADRLRAAACPRPLRGRCAPPRRPCRGTSSGCPTPAS